LGLNLVPVDVPAGLNSDDTTFASAPANFGGGGGGGDGGVANTYPSGGGSGVVIIRYPTGSMTATGGTISQIPGFTVHAFTASGTFTRTG